MTTVVVIPAQPAVTQVVREATPEQVQLTMDRKTAEVLRLVTAKIGGSRDGLRGEMDKVSNALNTAGVRVYGMSMNEDLHVATRRVAEGVIYFKG